MSAIERLAKQVGFHNSYTNSFAEQVYATDGARHALLKAMGYPVDDDKDIEQAIIELTNKSWLRLLPATQIIKVEAESYELEVTTNQDNAPANLQWKIKSEQGEVFDGRINLALLTVLAEKTIAQVSYKRYSIKLPKLSEGYHNLEASIEGDKAEICHCHLIVAPKSCYGPKDVADYKMWGLATQLYSLKSENSWGIGDFGDLANLVEEAASKGASTIGLNPLHPLFPGNTAHRSPYSPTSRKFLNTIYIDVTKAPNYQLSSAAQELVNSSEFQRRLKKANSSSLIDYPESAALKYEVLELLYLDFVNEHLNKKTKLAEQFKSFRNEFGKELKVLATFDALYEHFRAKDFHAFGWTSWPTEYHDPKSTAVKAFQKDYAHRVTYFEFTQWIADQQLEDIASNSKKQGMQIGLYLDLAVGCDGGGADVWSNQAVYVAGGSVGAPPDFTNRVGQNWGLTPINPLVLKEQGFQPLVQALRGNMRHAGALRIDHVLGYMRQYWVAPGMRADEGIYISFPFEDMLRIIALESRRTKCIVIGEDLGTTPEGFGEIMAAAGLLSYRLLYFERWENGLFKRPAYYPEQSMVTVSTHDLPTLKGWWTGEDLNWREKLELYPNQQAGVVERNARKNDRDLLIAAMQDMQLIEDDKLPSCEPAIMNQELATAVHHFLAKAPSRIQLIPMEDALGMEQQVNIPGTIDEHPNWLQRLSYDMDEIWQQDAMKNLIQVMQQERSKKSIETRAKVLER
ncbi:MAG: 4-alpha-glucanotransferase [Gammaproteobacteria bacterium]|nr:MAG: 4-alpha-glucanotransferase [Gammaproteobacteria bacterium]